MIKVIASDMDGTLLGDDHRIAPETIAAVHDACDAGIRFMIVTGRNFPGAMSELKNTDLVCDYIVSSGAEIRDPQKNVVSACPMETDLCREVYGKLEKYPVAAIFCTDGYDYRIGTSEEIEESMIVELQDFSMNMTREEVLETPLFRHIKENTRIVPGLDELAAEQVPVYKIFLFSGDTEMLEEIRLLLEKEERIAVSSSFPTNLEITDVKAQKGPVLRRYIESLGYTMEEVMVLGDSLNDYSMMSMDFGATVAMGNAVQEIRDAAAYITGTNNEHGVARAIREVLKSQGKEKAETEAALFSRRDSRIIDLSKRGKVG